MPGRVYHLISRFVAKEWFIEGAHERSTYLSLLGGALEHSRWRCFCFAIMSSHIHLGLIAGDEPLEAWLRPMHTTFANWMNERRERIGAVFVKGPNVIAVYPSGAAPLINYVHNNPVRARVVALASESDWTSHRAYVGLARRPPWLAVEDGLRLAGFDSGAALAAWCDARRVSKDELDEHRVEPRRAPGRPSKWAVVDGVVPVANREPPGPPARTAAAAWTSPPSRADDAAGDASWRRAPDILHEHPSG